MTTTIKTRNTALFDEWHKCIEYLPKNTKVEVSNDEPVYLGLWADKEYSKVLLDGKTGYMLVEALDKEGN